MEAKGFFSSLFDYSFSSFITPRIIRVLYMLATIGTHPAWPRRLSRSAAVAR